MTKYCTNYEEFVADSFTDYAEDTSTNMPPAMWGCGHRSCMLSPILQIHFAGEAVSKLAKLHHTCKTGAQTTAAANWQTHRKTGLPSVGICGGQCSPIHRSACILSLGPQLLHHDSATPRHHHSYWSRQQRLQKKNTVSRHCPRICRQFPHHPPAILPTFTGHSPNRTVPFLPIYDNPAMAQHSREI